MAVTIDGTNGINDTVLGSSTPAAASVTTFTGTTVTAQTAFVPDASDGAALGTTALEFSDLFLADGAVINLGDDQDVTITHVADTGIALNSKDIAGVASINKGQIGGRRNILYNGEMKVAQRSASVAGLGAAGGYFTLDRWQMVTGASAGRFTMAQVADGPPGFANCLKLTTTTADTSIAAGEHLLLSQNIEGQDLQQLKKGTASAEQFTMSFWVKGNASAVYVVEVYDSDNSARVTHQSFAVTTSWNRIELTFTGDTTGALDDDNATSLSFSIWLHAGADFTSGTFVSNTWSSMTHPNRAAVDDFTSIYDATSRTFFITGVQWEIGATATEFESRTFGEELALCQRYYEKSYNQGVNPATSTRDSKWARIFGAAITTYFRDSINFRVTKRSGAPTLTIYSVTGASGNVRLNNGSDLAIAQENTGDTSGSFFVNRTWAAGDFLWFHYVAEDEL
jgi:hypothetical protein